MEKQKKKQWSIIHWLTTFILTCSSTIVLVWGILPSVITTSREKLQKELAKELGVEIQDYPYPYSFPSGYFSTMLKPGMSIAEVHEIVRGYKQVLHCDNTAEIYYYLSIKLKDTERFEIIYDDKGEYKEFRGEDSNSPTIGMTDGCLPGLMNE